MTLMSTVDLRERRERHGAARSAALHAATSAVRTGGIGVLLRLRLERVKEREGDERDRDDNIHA